MTATVPRRHLRPDRPSRAIIAYSGLVTMIACICLIAPIIPGVAARPALGGLMLAAALLSLLIELVAQSPSTLATRLVWAGLAGVTGIALMVSSQQSVGLVRLTLTGFLLIQAAILAGSAARARRAKEPGGLPLGAEGLATLLLAIFTVMAFPFDQGWVLGAVIAVGLLDYAAALAFLTLDTGTRRVQ